MGQKGVGEIVLFGDSLTSAQVATNRLLGLVSPRWKIVNAGNGGDGYAALLARISDVTARKLAEWAVVLCGINDICGGRTANQIKAGLQAVYDLIFLAGIAVCAQTITPWGASAFWNAGRQAVTDEVNYWVMHEALRVAVRMDVYTLFESPADTLNSAYDNGDGLHLNALGSAKLQSADYSMMELRRFM